MDSTEYLKGIWWVAYQIKKRPAAGYLLGVYYVRLYCPHSPRYCMMSDAIHINVSFIWSVNVHNKY